jgi:hypothetical protein
MKIKKDLIGKKIRGGILNKWYTIEEGQEERYLKLGLLNIFEIDTPLLTKNVKDRKKSDKLTNSDSDGNDNNSSSKLSL